MFDRIRWRLVGWSVLVVGLILLLLGSAIYLSLARSLMDTVDQELLSSSEASLEELRESGRPSPEGYHGGVFYLVTDSAGQALANPQEVAAPSLPRDLLTSGAPEYRTVDLAGEPVRIYARPIREPGLGPSILITGQSLGAEEAALSRLLLILLAGGGAGLVLALGGAWFLAARALGPIKRAFERQQEFVADASHELRTPLTILHSATDLLDQRSDQPLRASRALFDGVRQEIARMERLTGDLLTLARSDRGELRLALGRLDLGLLAESLAQRVALLAEQRGIVLETDTSHPGVVVEGDPDRLQQVGLILLDNALEHTPPGGHVRVRVRREGAEGLFQVVDTGEGIPAEQLPRVFDRFYRLDRARSRGSGGAGLGLAIAHALVAAHGGHIALSSRRGEGTCVTVRLPLPMGERWRAVQGPPDQVGAGYRPDAGARTDV